ncbi:MAG: OmpA family protein [Steroidobacteraceae bacterium]|jgi:outer membrane protein OmpA-like peptidoglycan-associated protein|nr:OmpA family protein [Steroidobacteraceae bacterium]
MMKRTLIAAIAIAMSAGAAHAQTESTRNELTKEEGVGMLGGAAAGAIVGGPIGAAVGLMVGGVLGDSIGMANRANVHAKELELQARQLERELTDARIQLAAVSEQAGGDEMLDALAARLHADVLFRTGGSELGPDMAMKLEELGKLLAMHRRLEVDLHGFADPRGDAERNLELSFARASAVRDALIRGGAAADQIRVSAHGEDLSTAPKDDLEAYAWERRVSLAIRPVAEGALAQSAE